MVIFITSKKGFTEIKETIISKKWPVWIGQSILSETQIKKIRDQGVSLTVFNSDFSDSDSEEIENALYTIQEHHPDESILVERKISIL